MSERVRHARGRSHRSDRLANATPESCLLLESAVSKIFHNQQTEPESALSHSSRLRLSASRALASFKWALSQIPRSVKYGSLVLATSKIGVLANLANFSCGDEVGPSGGGE